MSRSDTPMCPLLIVPSSSLNSRKFLQKKPTTFLEMTGLDRTPNFANFSATPVESPVEAKKVRAGSAPELYYHLPSPFPEFRSSPFDVELRTAATLRDRDQSYQRL